ncbi:MAG: hypothetical protein C4547_01465 [Phycisphaerales bacterium]|nr:MAG: hypothetical protein C4547_01465 [Phycisphaerales bacterium]
MFDHKTSWHVALACLAATAAAIGYGPSARAAADTCLNSACTSLDVPPDEDDDADRTDSNRWLIPIDPDRPIASKECVYKVTGIIKKKNCDECPKVGDLVAFIKPRTCSRDSDCPNETKGWLKGCHGLFKKCKVSLEFYDCM